MSEDINEPQCPLQKLRGNNFPTFINTRLLKFLVLVLCFLFFLSVTMLLIRCFYKVTKGIKWKIITYDTKVTQIYLIVSFFVFFLLFKLTKSVQHRIDVTISTLLMFIVIMYFYFDGFIMFNLCYEKVFNFVYVAMFVIHSYVNRTLKENLSQ